MDIIENTYLKLKQRQDISGYEYSREWLGKSQGYFAYLQCSGAEPATDALLKLWGKALENEDYWKQYIQRHSSKRETGHLKGIVIFYQRLAEEIGEAVKKTALNIH